MKLAVLMLLIWLLASGVVNAEQERTEAELPEYNQEWAKSWYLWRYKQFCQYGIIPEEVQRLKVIPKVPKPRTAPFCKNGFEYHWERTILNFYDELDTLHLYFFPLVREVNFITNSDDYFPLNLVVPNHITSLDLIRIKTMNNWRVKIRIEGESLFVDTLIVQGAMFGLGGTGEVGLSWVEKLRNVREAHIILDNYEHLKYFESLKNLEIMNFSIGSPEVADLKPFLSSNRLKVLEIRCFDPCEIDFGTLRGKLGLEELVLSNVLADYSFISQLHKLERLHLLKYPYEMLDGIPHLHNLEDLAITGPLKGASSLKTLPLLGKLKKLSKVFLAGTMLKDIGFLDGVSSLENLSVSEIPVSDPALIFKNSSLIKLYVEKTGLKSIHGVKKLKGLKSLNVRGNLIQDLSPIAHLTKLEFLLIDCNPDKSYDFLASLPSLDYVTVNKLQEFQSLFEDLRRKGVTVKDDKSCDY